MAARGRHGCRTSRSMNTRKFIYLCLQTLRLFKSRKRARQLDCNSFLFNFVLVQECSEALQHQPPLLSRACRFASTHSGRSHHVSLSINDDGDAVGPHAALLLTLPQHFDGGSWM